MRKELLRTPANAMASRTTAPDGLGASQAETEKLRELSTGRLAAVAPSSTPSNVHAPGPPSIRPAAPDVAPVAVALRPPPDESTTVVAPAGSAMRQSATGPAAEPTVNGYTAIGLVRPDRS